jgi:hypothetical protein
MGITNSLSECHAKLKLLSQSIEPNKEEKQEIEHQLR